MIPVIRRPRPIRRRIWKSRCTRSWPPMTAGWAARTSRIAPSSRGSGPLTRPALVQTDPGPLSAGRAGWCGRFGAVGTQSTCRQFQRDELLDQSSVACPAASPGSSCWITADRLADCSTCSYRGAGMPAGARQLQQARRSAGVGGRAAAGWPRQYDRRPPGRGRSRRRRCRRCRADVAQARPYVC